MVKEALFWKELENSIQCQLCPHYCSLKSNQIGKCHVRKNIDNKLVSLSYSNPISINLDPIEKKPLYHFLPGTKSLSVGMPGCNLKCGHCQNFEISQESPEELKTLNLSPREIVDKAVKMKVPSISYTYTEPLVSYEMVLETARLAKEKDIKNILVTNGFINKKPLEKILPYIDAANVDLKAMNEKHYKDICGARLKPVLETIKKLHKENIWIELTNLLIPRINDSREDVEKLVEWVKDNLGNNTPIHFSAFYPAYNMKDKPQTPKDKVKDAREIALKKGIKFAYTGNINYKEGSNTLCPGCGKTIIKRGMFGIDKKMKREKGKVKDKDKEACTKCGEVIPGVWY